MFTKLQRDAARIDTAVKSLRTRVPAVINSYTYNDPPAAPIVQRRLAQCGAWTAELTGWLHELERFERLVVGEVRPQNAAVGAELAALAAEYALTECVVVAAEESADGEQTETTATTGRDGDNKENARPQATMGRVGGTTTTTAGGAPAPRQLSDSDNGERRV